ncbi:DUF3800 domain-containing protein [Pseudobacillus badius]|uniref:DUF3800 domain-containing protein n=1 Tax=Bacillus badius TaxID=1455 RepID=UPI0007B090E7|nr:DUF3800 domain-containing protein [Bacillus badius]KZO00489.1 hypothetical protein A4244_15590 [Bacillus badius]OCS87069.1 hypothetical protein A6M11_15605 [Bacillus badius]OVE46056.1 DUF3800 domain-containing protein [Bacillus badius]TDV97586.1 uncharacterized protein DUF3800 [Bacillus badius]
MDSYILFLDEILPSGNLKYFCLAGYVVEQELYAKEIIPEINELKQELFGNTTVILHEAEIHRPERDTPYEIFKQAKFRNLYWDRIKEIFKKYNLYILSASIHEKDLKHLYPGMRDKYFICLQIILENYVNFLERHNGTGNITIESRNQSQNEQLQGHFYNLKATGTLFYEPKMLQKHLGTISFPLKAENNVGLQLADMIPNSLNRDLSNAKQRTKGLIDIINSNAYDGLIDEKQRFGIKVIPRISNPK